VSLAWMVAAAVVSRMLIAHAMQQQLTSLICACLLTIPWVWWWYDPFYFILCAFHIFRVCLFFANL